MGPNKNRKKKVKNWMLAVIALVIIAIIAVHPIGRSVLIWLLPMGSGFDDIIALVAIVLAAVIVLYKLSSTGSDKIGTKIKKWLNR